MKTIYRAFRIKKFIYTFVVGLVQQLKINHVLTDKHD